ncbi:unnamed protein product [Phytophthora lilii]|uniref:Unnamed protein product n=1 Tax=Phytophthora lilii TaxID=2077276 RepID=A0A9W6TH93_9STRA|nr:unnamed protein product [Phytophthora lilii]
MKVPKMLIDYTLRFGIPIALCYAYWDPKSDDEIRRDVVRAASDLASGERVAVNGQKLAAFAHLLVVLAGGSLMCGVGC